MDNSKLTQPIIPILISMALAAILFFITEDFVRAVIVMPLLKVFWFISLVISSIPQGAIWVVIIFLFSGFSIITLSKNQSRKRPREAEANQVRGPVEKWAQFLENGRKNPFSKWLLAKELKRFSRKLMSNSDGLQPGQIDIEGSGFPEDIAAFLNAPQPSGNQDQLTLHPDHSLDLDPEIVIQYFEEKMS